MHHVPRSSHLLASLVGALALIFAAPAAAWQGTPDDKGKVDKLVCKRQAPTGTRFAKKTCRTRTERDKISEEHKRTAAEMINAPVVYDCRPTGC